VLVALGCGTDGGDGSVASDAASVDVAESDGAGGVTADSQPPSDAGFADDACNIGCIPEFQASICGSSPPGVVWLCLGSNGFDRDALEKGGCTDLATDVPRFCCPVEFLPQCR
jgi:hypothetical protein